MRKYLIRYLVFWFPAFVASVFFSRPGNFSQLAQIFFGFFMLFGWAANTYMAARRYPSSTLTLLLFYSGSSLVLTDLQYKGTLRQLFGDAHYMVGGIFSYIPMDIFIQKTLDFKIQHEIYVIAVIVAFALLGWIAAILFRYNNPDPARPKFVKK